MTPGHAAGTPSYTYVHDKLALTRADLVSPTATVPAFAFGYDQPRNLSAVGQYDVAGATIPTTVCLLHDALGRLSVVGPALGRLPGPGALACRSESDLEQSQPKVHFEYDAFNRRVARLDGSTWTEFLHDPAGNLLAELTRPSGSSTWSSSRDYVWLDGLPLAQLEYPGPAGRTDGYTYYFHLDHLGLPRALTSEAGATIWSALPARPYGDVAETTTTDPVNGRTIKTNLRLPGQYDERLLTALGIQGPYYNWNRWYLPAMGRYLELDPIAMHGGFNGPFGPNWYGYAEGNPLRWSDPEGLEIYSACWMRCIDKYRFDILWFVPFSAVPKRLVPPFRVPYPSQPLTTLPSVAQHYLPEFLGNGLRTGGRLASKFATPLTIAEGVWDIGVVGTCAAACGIKAPEERASCH